MVALTQFDALEGGQPWRDLLPVVKGHICRYEKGEVYDNQGRAGRSAWQARSNAVAVLHQQ